MQVFLLTRLMRGAALKRRTMQAVDKISTHAPHARRGEIKRTIAEYRAHFYSRASCEARQAKYDSMIMGSEFLLTRLMRGAAFKKVSVGTVISFLLTRLMRGAAPHRHKLPVSY